MTVVSEAPWVHVEMGDRVAKPMNDGGLLLVIFGLVRVPMKSLLMAKSRFARVMIWLMDVGNWYLIQIEGRLTLVTEI